MPPLVIEPLGDECARARILAGLSPPQAAAKLGCTATHVRGVESGKHNASPGLLRKMADLYGVEMESLFEFAKPNEAA